MVPDDKKVLSEIFKNCVRELRENMTSNESLKDAWMVIWSRKWILGENSTPEDIDTTDAELEIFWNRNPEVAKASLFEFIKNCEFPV